MRIVAVMLAAAIGLALGFLTVVLAAVWAKAPAETNASSREEARMRVFMVFLWMVASQDGL